MRFLFDNRRHLIIALHDAGAAGLSLLLAVALRWGYLPSLTLVSAGDTAVSLPLLALGSACVGALVFSRMRLYRGLWRYASLTDLLAITQAATLALLIFYLLLFLFNRLDGMPRSVPFIQWLLLVALLGAPRFFYRIWRDKTLGLRINLREKARVPVLLIGANDRAELFLRDTRSGGSSHYVVVAIIDDRDTRAGHTMHGVPIYSGLGRLPEIVEKLARRRLLPQRVILTEDQPSGALVREVLTQTEALGLTLGRLPRLSEFKPGTAQRLDIQPIAVEDLLGRPQNVHDKTPVKRALAGKRVLITGAGGSIGSELVRQIARFEPAFITLFDHSEYALYQIDRELANAHPALARRATLGTVRNGEQLLHALQRDGIHVIFHAAAIKHVPLAEANPEEAVLTNLFGTKTLADAARQAHVETMVLISTDKAVAPTNVMGASKRAAELYCQALGRESPATRFVSVRFGNVLGSTGSVVPLFQQQLQAGGPLTVTHAEMVRYFMTVREAVELVLQASTLEGDSGETYVLDMGQPVRILDLAQQMIRLAGFTPHKDIAISFTGLRPGEKMYEELFHDAASVTTAHDGIWRLSEPPATLSALAPTLAALKQACDTHDAARVATLLRQIVPDYLPASSLPSAA